MSLGEKLATLPSTVKERPDAAPASPIERPSKKRQKCLDWNRKCIGPFIRVAPSRVTHKASSAFSPGPGLTGSRRIQIGAFSRERAVPLSIRGLGRISADAVAVSNYPPSNESVADDAKADFLVRVRTDVFVCLPVIREHASAVSKRSSPRERTPDDGHGTGVRSAGEEE